MSSERALLLGLVLAAAPALAAAPLFDAVPPSRLSYHVTHKFHEVDGVCQEVEGKARLAPDGTLQVMIRAKVACFDSGNGNRDAHMLEVVDAARFPFVELKAVAHGVSVPARLPGTVATTLEAQVALHGVTRTLSIPVRLDVTAPGKVTVHASYPISLTAFGIERPSLAFIKVEDTVPISVELTFAEEAG